MKKNMIPIVLSVSICSLIIMLTTYVHVATMTKLEENYYMSSNHKVFRKGDISISFLDVFDIDKNSNILVISEYFDKDYIGIYDPMMVLARENSYQLIGYTRYFNTEDYKTRTNAGVFLSDIERQEQCQALGKQRLDVVLYCAENTGRFKEGINYLVNLSSFDDLGDTIYVDFDEPKSVEPIIKRISGFGYQEISSENYKFFKVFKEADFGQIIIFVTITMALYALFYMMSYWHFLNDRKHIYLHFLHGGSEYTIFLRYLKPYLVGNTLSLFFIYLIKVILSSIQYLRYSNLAFVLLVLLHLLFSSILLLISFLFVYKKVTRLYGELDYVN